MSFANNLIGRALLDKGDARGAAQTLLSNYRSNPGGERAQDSLYYLAQALMKLGQPGQACKAYGELDAVYGAKVRPDLKKLENEAKAQALMTATQKLGEAMYAKAQAETQSAQGDPGASAASGEGKHGDEKVVDAEFTEVKDKK